MALCEETTHVIVQASLMWTILTFALLPWAVEPELTARQRAFLDEEAVYLLTESEAESFRALPTSSERDEFIERFWQVRDPVPETAVNEFREEHEKRIREATEKFRESRAGWRTDRGRVYITLGPPQDVQAYPSSQDLYPLEIWFYYNLDIPTFPSALTILFYKRNGVGEYRLFSPAFDGMKELIADRVTRGMIGPLGQVPFEVRRRWDIDVVKAAESVGPGENMLSSEVILAELRTPGFVFEKTRRNLSSRVTAEASFGGELPVDLSIAYFRGEGDFSEAHFALEIPADQLHVNQYDHRMLGRYDLIGTLTQVASGEVLEELRDSLEIENLGGGLGAGAALPDSLSEQAPALAGTLSSGALRARLRGTGARHPRPRRRRSSLRQQGRGGVELRHGFQGR